MSGSSFAMSLPLQSLEHSLADQVSRPRRSLVLPAAAAGSLLLHVAVLGFAILQLSRTEAIGGGGTTLEAISVEVITSAALDSRLAQPVIDANAASSAVIAEADGQLVESAAATPPVETEASATAPAIERSTPKTDEAPTPPDPDREAGPRDAVVVREVVADVPAPAFALSATPPSVLPEPAERPREPPQDTAQSSPPPSAAAAGGVAARGSDGQTGASAAAAASPGALRRYAIAVSKALESAKAKSQSQRRRGRAVVTFVLTADGELERAELAKPSGDAAIDQAALALFRRASFPEPPAGARRAELTYTVPIEFR